MTRCEFIRINHRWHRVQCKRNATIFVHGKNVCEQHAKILVGMASDVRTSASDRL